jgi:hypothetical protein
MLKTAFAAALLVSAASFASPSASAKAVQYGFDTAGGGAYCDGLLLTMTGTVFTGTHNSPTGSCTEGDQAGGFYSNGFSSGAMGSYDTVTAKTKLATITTEDPGGGTNFEIIFNLDIKGKVWAVYVIEDGATPVNGGPLSIGADAKTLKPLSRASWQK